MDIAAVRQHVEKIDGVSKTWFEWTNEDGSWLKTLVVEVDFDTDPNAVGFRSGVLEDIQETTLDALNNKTTMVVSYLKIVPKQS